MEIEFPFRLTACQSKEKLLGTSLKSVSFLFRLGYMCRTSEMTCLAGNCLVLVKYSMLCHKIHEVVN